MKFLLKINNTMAGRFVLGPWLACIGFFIDDAKQMLAGDKAIRKAWLLHAIGLAIVLPVVQFGFGMPLWLYVLVPVWLGQSLISIRTFAEHQWSERPEGRTIIVERSPLSFLFLNNNLHFVHHKSPTVPWYRLPKLFRDRRDEWLKAEQWLCLPELFRAAESLCLQGQGAGRASGAAPRAGAGQGVQAARARRASSERARHRAGAGRAAEGMSLSRSCGRLMARPDLANPIARRSRSRHERICCGFADV